MKIKVTSDSSPCVCTESGFICVCVYIYTYMRVCAYLYVYVHAYTHQHMPLLLVLKIAQKLKQTKLIPFLSCHIIHRLNMVQNLLIFFYVSPN